MKTILTAAVLVLFAGGACFAANGAREAYDNESYQGDKKEFAIEKAVEDINANMEFLLRMHKEVDAATGLWWEIAIADKLPSQTVAVLRLMARSDVAVDQMCPRIVIEDMLSDYDYDRWMERAVSSLESFTMTRPAEEKIRRDCLEKIRKALAASPRKKKTQ